MPCEGGPYYHTNLQYLIELNLWLFEASSGFVSCLRAVKARARLYGCAGLPGLILLTFVILPTYLTYVYNILFVFLFFGLAHNVSFEILSWIICLVRLLYASLCAPMWAENLQSFRHLLNFKDIAWPDRLNKSGSMLSQSEGQILIDIMNGHGLEQLVHFPTLEKNTLDLILTSVPGQFQEIHSPDKLSDHDVVSGTLKVYIPQKRNLGGRCIYIKKEILSR